MKRPEGLDGAKTAAQRAQKEQKALTAQRAGPGRVGKPETPERARPPKTTQATEPLDKAARRDHRRATRARLRYEKSEVRRFTRRTRRRRITWLVLIGIALTMVALVAVAVYSPLLALKTIEIEGTSRIDPADIHAAVDDQLDTPLALVDFDHLTEQLGDFPLIRSYVTETVPPNTLVIHIVERQPIGSLASGSGFELVDPAGIVIEKSQDRIAGVPLIEIGGEDSDSEAFDAAVEVLLALPDTVLSQLDTITASSTDNVRLTLIDRNATIIWGSADDSAYKARVLAAGLLNVPDASEYNVSAPGQFTTR